MFPGFFILGICIVRCHFKGEFPGFLDETYRYQGFKFLLKWA
jgi:hypothetical protein